MRETAFWLYLHMAVKQWCLALRHSAATCTPAIYQALQRVRALPLPLLHQRGGSSVARDARRCKLRLHVKRYNFPNLTRPRPAIKHIKQIHTHARAHTQSSIETHEAHLQLLRAPLHIARRLQRPLQDAARLLPHPIAPYSASTKESNAIKSNAIKSNALKSNALKPIALRSAHAIQHTQNTGRQSPHKARASNHRKSFDHTSAVPSAP